VTFESAVTAVAFAPATRPAPDGRRSYTLAVGLENGHVHIWSISRSDSAPSQIAYSKVWQTDRFTRHVATVRSIRWRTEDQDQQHLQAHEEARRPGAYEVATCSNDHSVCVFQVTM